MNIEQKLVASVMSGLKALSGADSTGDWRISAGKRAVGIGIQCYQGLFEPDNRFFGMD